MKNKDQFNFYFMDSNREVTTKEILIKTNHYIYDWNKKHDFSNTWVIWFAIKTEYPKGILKMQWDLISYNKITLLELINAKDSDYSFPLINALNLHYEYYDRKDWVSYYDYLRKPKNFVEIKNLIEVEDQEVDFWNYL